MHYSAHRPGRFDSQGRISFDVDSESANPTGPTTLDDEAAYLLRDYQPTGTVTDTIPDAAATTLAVDTVGVPAQAPESADEPRRDTLDETGETGEIGETGETHKPATSKVETVRAPRVRPPRPPRPPRAPRPEGWRLRRLAILGGADGPVLDTVPSETPRFVQMFFVLLGTALVSALSMMFALTTGVRVALWIAVPLAVVWALIIFNLDRFLTSTMTSTRSVVKLIGLAIPRVLMAALIGFVVAEPIVLQAFQNDIAREVATTNIVQAQSDQDALDSGPEKLALDAATTRLGELENQAATGIVAGTSGESASKTAAQGSVDDLNAQMADQQKVIDDARALYQCELTGEGVGTVPGCTGINGEGASSGAAKSQLDQAQQTYDALAAQLRTANDDLAAADTAAKSETSASEQTNRQLAKDQLPAARATYDQALAAYNARADAVAQGNAGAIGLLSQISALGRLGEKEPAILWAHWLIAALFFMIELLPVIVKVLTSWGDPSLYEKAAAIRHQVATDRITAQGFRDRADIVLEESAAKPTATSQSGASDEDSTTSIDSIHPIGVASH